MGMAFSPSHLGPWVCIREQGYRSKFITLLNMTVLQNGFRFFFFFFFFLFFFCFFFFFFFFCVCVCVLESNFCAV